MTTVKPPALPRDTTRQSQGILYGAMSKRINRISGSIIVLFVLVHVLGLAVVYWSALRPILHLMPWLDGVQFQPWFHAIYAVLFPAVTFHTLYSVKLIAMDFGVRMDYRISFWTISALSVGAALWGAFGYVSH
jgi:succinate dehydrogenase/fumarate reductase cytochrome b subunit